MKELINGVFVLTADDEKPDCMRCVNVQCGDEYCCNNCGADNFWQGYERHTTSKKYWEVSDGETEN